MSLYFSSPDSNESARQKRLIAKGQLRRIGNTKVLTDDLVTPEETIIRKNIFEIIGRYYGGAVMSHRSAIEFIPHDGVLYFTYKRTVRIEYPGLTIQFIKGRGATEFDKPYLNDNVYVSSTERAWLENLQSARSLDKCVPIESLEKTLHDIIIRKGEDSLNKSRDRARSISEELGMKKEFKKLDSIIGALFTTDKIEVLSSKPARAMAKGEAYDEDRIEMLGKLFTELKGQVFEEYSNQRSQVQNQFFNFFESYFSNYIEGTTFTVEEAKEMSETNVPIPARNEESHDFLGVLKMISSTQMITVPASQDELITILKQRHFDVMKNRPAINPGEWKSSPNRAGATQFVDPKLIEGTLKKGFSLYENLEPGFQRAAFITFMISEVHPFKDGNGRISRIMMNAEFHTMGYSHILIPSSYRTDYLAALRRLSHASDSRAFIRMLKTIYKFSSEVNGETFDRMWDYLKEHNAFSDDDEIILKR